MDNGTGERKERSLVVSVVMVVTPLLVLVVILGGLVLLGVLFKDKIQAFQAAQAASKFPKPAKMPAKLKVSMKDALARLEKALDSQLKSQMRPGLGKQKITGLCEGYDLVLPGGLDAVYAWHDGSTRSEQSLAWFVPLEESLKVLAKNREKHQDVAQGGGLNDRALHNMVAYRRNWVTLYRNSAYYSLNVDVARKPEEGAYFWTSSSLKGYYFFPSLENAIVALAECFEKNAFKAIASTEKKRGVLGRNDLITGANSKQLLVNNKRIHEAMGKYGTFEKADGFLTH